MYESWQNRFPKLPEILKKHLSYCAVEGVTEKYIWMLCTSYDFPTGIYLASKDKQTLENLLKHLRQAISDMRELTPSGRKDIFRGTRWSGNETPNPLEVWLEISEAFSHSILKFLSKKELRFASEKISWEALSVADQCRILWAESAHMLRCFSQSSLEDNTDYSYLYKDGYHAYLENYAPISQKYDAPGPFGRFLQDVFEAMEIRGDDGCAYSAHSALRALAAVKRERERRGKAR